MNENIIEKFKEYDEVILELKEKNYLFEKEMDLMKSFIIKSSHFIDDNLNYCPICGNFSNFKSFGITHRSKALCPHCNSLERHRFIYFLFYKRFGYVLDNSIKVLHFAPEIPFYNLFKNKKNIDYFPVDLNPEIYENRNIHIRDKIDMENIVYDDNSFDFIYHGHVLEHIPNDLKAMGELYRVLKDDGVCVTSAPVFNIPQTIEKEEYNTPELRLIHYGQEDHLRKYGLDFSQRLESVGFNVEEVSVSEIIPSPIERELYGIRNDRVYICTK